MCSSNVPNSSFISRNFFALLTNDSTFFRFPIMPGLFRIESTLLFVCREILLGLDLLNAFLYAGLLYSVTIQVPNYYHELVMVGPVRSDILA